ncbi:hypothetical protein KDL44_09070 [bacterium]|nr:hypothetical protein [bacterium]
MKYILDRILPELRALMGEALELYQHGQFQDALESLDSKLADLEILVADMAHREAVRYNLLHTRLGILAGLGADMRTEMDAFLADLQQEAMTRMGNAERLAMLIRQLTIRDGMFDEQFSEADFDGMLTAVPPDACSIRFWSDVSLWAFRREYLHPLSAAVEHALFNPAPAHEILVWKRIHLMFGSVDGSLGDAELQAYISSISSQAQLREFESSIIELLRVRGQWSAAAQKKLERVRVRLHRAETAQ